MCQCCTHTGIISKRECLEKPQMKRSVETQNVKSRKGGHMKGLLNVLFIIIIIAFVRKHKSGNSFTTEFLLVVDSIIGFFRKPNTANKNIENEFDEFNRRLNIRIHAIYDGNMKGWSYNVTNPSYLVMHDKPLEIVVYLNSGLKITAKVCVKDGEILEIVELNSPFEKNVTSQPQKVAVSQTDSEVESDETVTVESTNTEVPEMTDVEAYNLAKSHVSDVALTLNSRANDAIADKKEAFIWIPEIQTNSLILSKMAKILIDEFHFKNVIIDDDNKLIVFVNLDTPADDGNFDFDESQKEEIHNEKSSPEFAAAEPEDAELEYEDHPIIVEDDDIPDAPDLE